ncbi:MAG TPA: hypothetical protein VKQ08_02685 [Cyclobacteriaceae bacterium]|nr:hypothetical protein [Cyclobacteriaceae bacterium]
MLTIPVALIMLGCRDINYVMPAYKPPVDIYLAGAKLNGTDTAWSATYWKNGVPTSLTDGLTNSSLFGVCVTDSGIYAAGYEGIFLKYWRNGIGISLGDSSRAAALSVIQADVYIAGWTRSNTAVYWKNGSQHILSLHAAATSIAVSGSDVYLAGYQGGIDLTASIVWKNGAPLSDLQANGEINSIVVSGPDVFAAGSYLALASQNPRACYWKNSALILLSDASHIGSANSIFVSGEDVYVAGYETNASGFKVAKYWKNSIANSISDGTRSQEAHAIAVAHGDVYVTCDGSIPNSSILMKNGSMVAPFDGTSNKYYAFGLLVK